MSHGKGRSARELQVLQHIDRLDAWDIIDWTDALTGQPVGGIEITGVRVKATPEGDSRLLVVLTGFDEAGGPVVAFHAGNDFVDALAGAMRRAKNGSLKWKVDTYATARGGG